MATKPLQMDDEGRVMDEETRKNQKSYEAYEREQSDAQRRLEERDKRMMENARKVKEKIKSVLPFKKGGVAKTVTKEMEYDYKTGKKSFRGTTEQRDVHAEKEGKRVAKDLAYDKSKYMKKGGKVKKYESGGNVYSKERERDYPLSTKVAKMGDAAVEDILDFPKSTARGMGRYGLATAAYVPAIAVDVAKRAFRKDETKGTDGKKAGGVVRSSASKRADGCAIRGKTRA